jgi:hypothetical protein
MSLSPLVRQCLAVARTKDSFASTKAVIFGVIILGVWLSVVVFTATRHEFWRDEVRPLSLARAAVSPLDLYGLTQYDGHPIAWFLLLYIGKSIIDTQLILPITSIAIAFFAVAVFMFFSPFPFLVKSLFIFSALPVYEYSVMAQAYGLSMLLFFISALLYKNREKYPLLLSFALAILANTNVHSALLVCLITALWAYDMFAERRNAYVQLRGFFLYLPFIIVFIGVFLCIVFTMPRDNTILTHMRHSIGLRELSCSLFSTALSPGQTFSQIVPRNYPHLVNTALLYTATLGLLCRSHFFVAALSSQVALGVLFHIVYGGLYRHQGLFLIFLLFLYWVLIESLNHEATTKTKHLLFNIGLYGAMLILILGNVTKAKRVVWADLSRERSSGRAFGEFLNRSEIYRDAIIVPEPDYLLESLPYYAKNMIYLPREHRFGATVSWTTEANYRLSLGELLLTARSLKTRYGQPVLIVLGHWEVDKHKPAEKKYSYNKVFSWNANESADFNESAFLVTEFKSAYTDENYRIYIIK